MMTLLSIDPSSTITGVARWSGGRLVAAHRVRATAGWPAERRIIAIVNDIETGLRMHKPDRVVIEMPSGKVAGGRRGKERGLTVYAWAAGAIWWACSKLVDDVHVVTERDWTGGRRKATRAAELRMKYPVYAKVADEDKGMDVADAIGVGDWWISREAS